MRLRDSDAPYPYTLGDVDEGPAGELWTYMQADHDRRINRKREGERKMEEEEGREGEDWERERGEKHGDSISLVGTQKESNPLSLLFCSPGEWRSALPMYMPWLAPGAWRYCSWPLRSILAPVCA